MQLGAPRLAQGHHLLAWRAEPQLPETKLAYVWTIMIRRGPYAAWQLLKRFGDLTEAPAEIRCNWYVLHAGLVAMLRDFDTAEYWLAKAETVAPDDAWTRVTRSQVLRLEDRYQESLDAALQALALRPWYRPGVQAAAVAQINLGRDEEALAILAEADRHIE
jgi:tetratricopeptide (TPR) repeat protein